MRVTSYQAYPPSAWILKVLPTFRPLPSSRFRCSTASSLPWGSVTSATISGNVLELLAMVAPLLMSSAHADTHAVAWGNPPRNPMHSLKHDPLAVVARAHLGAFLTKIINKVGKEPGRRFGAPLPINCWGSIGGNRSDRGGPFLAVQPVGLCLARCRSAHRRPPARTRWCGFEMT